MFDSVAVGKLPDTEPAQANKHNSGAVQPADLQSTGLPGRSQPGTQVREYMSLTCYFMTTGQ